MANVFFSSDQHFFHSNVIKYCGRPYVDVDEMNSALVKNWNSVVKHEDTVYCLGDFSFAGRPVEIFSHALAGNKKLIPGNHDPIHPYNKHYKKSVKRGEPNYWKEFYESHGWTVLPTFNTIDIPGIGMVNMCHMPYDTQDQRYQDHTMADDGKWLLCGHIHEHWLKKGRMINVGVDRHNYTPINIDRIKELMEHRGDII